MAEDVLVRRPCGQLRTIRRREVAPKCQDDVFYDKGARQWSRIRLFLARGGSILMVGPPIPHPSKVARVYR